MTLEAADELNDLIRDIEGAFALQYTAPAYLNLDYGKTLAWKKKGEGFRLVVQSAMSVGDTPLIDSSLRVRIDAVKQLEHFKADLAEAQKDQNAALREAIAIGRRFRAELATACTGCGCTKKDCDAVKPPAIKCCPDCSHPDPKS